jgi:hypothetical protein
VSQKEALGKRRNCRRLRSVEASQIMATQRRGYKLEITSTISPFGGWFS